MTTQKVPFYRDELVYWIPRDFDVYELFTVLPLPPTALYQDDVNVHGYRYDRFNVASCPIDWRDDFKFNDRLEIIGIYKSTRYILKAKSNGFIYTMTMHDMWDALKKSPVLNAVFTGIWHFVKRGNWGVALVL